MSPSRTDLVRWKSEACQWTPRSGVLGWSDGWCSLAVADGSSRIRHHCCGWRGCWSHVREKKNNHWFKTLKFQMFNVCCSTEYTTNSKLHLRYWQKKIKELTSDVSVRQCKLHFWGYQVKRDSITVRLILTGRLYSGMGTNELLLLCYMYSSNLERQYLSEYLSCSIMQ